LRQVSLSVTALHLRHWSLAADDHLFYMINSEGSYGSLNSSFCFILLHVNSFKHRLRGVLAALILSLQLFALQIAPHTSTSIKVDCSLELCKNLLSFLFPCYRL
jgi:hypothetical protein